MNIDVDWILQIFPFWLFVPIHLFINTSCTTKVEWRMELLAKATTLFIQRKPKNVDYYMWWKIVHSRCLIFGRYVLFKETGPYFSLLFSLTHILDSMIIWLCSKNMKETFSGNIHSKSSHECNKYFKIILKNKCILYMLKMHSKIMYRV